MERDEYGRIVFGLRADVKNLKKLVGRECLRKVLPVLERMDAETKNLVDDLLKEEKHG